jgi:dTDP-4-dehydrorhamnose 3,5-epimerase
MSQFIKLSESSLSFPDERGSLTVLLETDSIVIKSSFSKKGVFRGLHWQREPFGQTKIIRVVEGEILDFVLDVTKDGNQLCYKTIRPHDGWILINSKYPHGFYSCTDTIFEYVCIGAYNEATEECFSVEHVLASELGLANVILSDKDRRGKKLNVDSVLEVKG